MTKNNLEANLVAAKRGLITIKLQELHELEAARVKIEASFRDSICAANKRVKEASKELQDHAIASAEHPLLGKKVTRTIREFHRFSAVKYTDTQIFGACEIFTESTPRRRGYCLHSPGDIIVRVLKKDGMPSLTVESVSGWSECK